ncbi:succinate dehydrogenase cytochrome b subunit [Corynebacterium uberis]|uniref:succinate dehydrogenase cytochrome b subunit n=1 Tax=Corynebacterium TaxID=1716 RepID=UPI001D0BD6EB|nr:MULTISPECIES: succinate dehydrogenase cytochrome b subunit [Corynebacterium]MCZ9309553.1 succinate dehydrogenase cytochrome b subunit [Corynebacterium sp. c6VSa_13]UDL73097.1 succinate dehydrogenase cytochrome b subunit [Corynebacterium uberis]UDL76026.1 succinate dehydrogenase cytochrome b subunit [Corynebacterium uberis]UDL78238.1 succinate dehydrogenase cytochrome b subunit [Corynebacterium uberis]UDL80521.1 succinate dehydrogenase cytochrome b subunit [Corynebacterium uberis]
MTVRNPDREAIRHGKITEEPIRKSPRVPSWALKLGMALSGLVFCGFVLVHMVGNLKLFLPAHDGVPAINEYGEFLREIGEPLFPRESILWILRILLLACLVIHVWGGIELHHRSRVSRGKFRRTNLIGGLNSFTSRTMLVTGIVLLLFIIFHILDLTLGVAPAASTAFEHGEVYANLVASFSRWPVALFYVASMIILFLHLSHGIWLAVSDLGITGRRTRSVALFLAYLIPAVVMVGNIILPLTILFGWVS